MSYANSTSQPNHISHPHTLSYNPSTLQHISLSTLKSEAETKGACGFFEVILAFLHGLFACFLSKEREKPFSKKELVFNDGSKLIEYKSWDNSTIRLKQLKNGNIWFVKQEAGNSPCFALLSPLLATIIQDLKKLKHTKNLYAAATNWSEAQQLHTYSKFTLTNKAPHDSRQPPFPVSFNFAPPNSRDKCIEKKLNRHKIMMRALNKYVKSCRRLSSEKVTKIGKLVHSLTNIKFDITNPSAICRAWERGERQGLKKYTLDTNELLTLSFDNSQVKEIIPEIGGISWPRVMVHPLNNK